MPGDIPDPTATTVGLAPRGNYPGEGDGDGVIKGIYLNEDCWGPGSGCASGQFFAAGETLMFWVDLSQAKLISDNFNTASSTVVAPSNSTDISDYFPQAKLGGSNYILAYSVDEGILPPGESDTNYYGLASITVLNPSGNGETTGGKGTTVAQAYAIDSKMDDGLPESGVVEAGNWAPAAQSGGTYSGEGRPITGSPTTCYDADSTGGYGIPNYSMSQNNGAGVNCALFFRFQ